MKKILVLDGGGVKGTLQNTVITELERAAGKEVWEMFDLIVGTSVGAINGAMHASGKMCWKQDEDLFITLLGKVFGKKHLFPPIYRSEEIRKAFDLYLGESFTMSQCRTKFMCTAVSSVDSRTHYFKSWEKKDGAENLFETVHRSFSAPYYFGQLTDEKNQQVWLDGGTGIANCPLIPAFVEANRQGWLTSEKDPVLFLNIGTGYSLAGQPFSRAKKGRTLSQLLLYLDPNQGGLARYQSTQYQRMGIENCCSVRTIIADTEIAKELDVMDNLKARDQYIELGKAVFRRIIAENPDLLEILAQPIE